MKVFLCSLSDHVVSYFHHHGLMKDFLQETCTEAWDIVRLKIAIIPILMYKYYLYKYIYTTL